MSARQKLNQSHFTTSLLLAALMGFLTGSWLLFLLTFMALLGLHLYTDEIRPPRQDY
jgi:hypothetical protein